jgi:hypothetical protein
VPTIESILVDRLAFLPEAGKLLAVPAVKLRIDTGAIVVPETTSCALTYRGRTLPRDVDGWTIPTDHRSRRLLLTVTATYRGATRTLTVPVTPR